VDLDQRPLPDLVPPLIPVAAPVGLAGINPPSSTHGGRGGDRGLMPAAYFLSILFGAGPSGWAISSSS
jgi:hypothetical protein